VLLFTGHQNFDPAMGGQYCSDVSYLPFCGMPQKGGAARPCSADGKSPQHYPPIAWLVVQL